MVFHWSLTESFLMSPGLFLGPPQQYYSLMVSTRPLISTSSCPRAGPLVTVPSAPITIDITVTFMFHSFSGL